MSILFLQIVCLFIFFISVMAAIGDTNNNRGWRSTIIAIAFAVIVLLYSVLL